MAIVLKCEDLLSILLIQVTFYCRNVLIGKICLKKKKDILANNLLFVFNFDCTKKEKSYLKQLPGKSFIHDNHFTQL